MVWECLGKLNELGRNNSHLVLGSKTQKEEITNILAKKWADTLFTEPEPIQN